MPEPTVTHTCDLVERHRITILNRDLPAGATDRVAVARLHAEAYARARGFEIAAGSFDVLSGSTTSPGSAFNGVAFDVVVGKGDIHLDQRVPGVLDRWTWSAGCVEWWQRRLGAPTAKLLSLVDDSGRVRRGRVTGMRPGDRPDTVEVEGQFTDAPGGFHGTWLGPEALRGFGIGVTPPSGDDQ